MIEERDTFVLDHPQEQSISHPEKNVRKTDAKTGGIISE